MLFFFQGAYSVDKYVFDTNIYKRASSGEYLAKFKAFFPADDKCIICGIDLTCKVVDKLTSGSTATDQLQAMGQ